MTDKVITFKIPEALAVSAEQLGLLSRDRVIAWLQTEIRRNQPVSGNEPAADEMTRQESLKRLQDAAIKLRALEPTLSLQEIEEDISAALNDHHP